ncbi:MAG TPA: hypothetical protein VJ822_11350, partial [Dongiaceae bacterium]|nr:hypothetical protein [Dongiaceae bacterium]
MVQDGAVLAIADINGRNARETVSGNRSCGGAILGGPVNHDVDSLGAWARFWAKIAGSTRNGRSRLKKGGLTR